MNDRQIGYLALGALSLFVGLCLVAVVRSVLVPVEPRVIVFEKVGSLRLEDPVLIRGVRVGMVHSIDLRDSRAIVGVAFDEPTKVYRDYHVETVEVGLMGERAVNVNCGTPSLAEIPPSDTLTGAFVMGPSEAVGSFYRLRDTVNALSESTRRFVEGDSGLTSPTEKIRRLITYSDSLSRQVLLLCSRLDESAARSLSAVDKAAADAADLAETVSAKAPEYISLVNKQMSNLEGILQDVEGLIRQLDTIIAAVNGPQAQQLQDQVARLNSQVKTLQQALDELGTKGTRLKIWPF